eukprot:CCRYP_004676-RC/>CCRYP_004676-RC protein AED:0.27 eAED:0.27 QI:62/1/1/1/0.83/0.71/7/2540/217
MVPSWCHSTMNPPPRITSTQVLTIGFGAFAAALIWPPILLIIALLLASCVPKMFFERDHAEHRRRLYRDFLKRDDLPAELQCNDVVLKEGYWTNSRGSCLFTSIMTPKSGQTIAVVCFCHGFLGSSSYLIRCEYQRMVKTGIAFVSIDYEGHGQSDGEQGLIPSWDELVGDSLDYFKETLQHDFPGKPAFLCGESMGGAVCFSIYEKCPTLWKGVVF